jgi:hypothetical protein
MGGERWDFLERVCPPGCKPEDYRDIVTNPPYSLATAFIEHALRLTLPRRGKVVMLLRHDFDTASSRHHLFGGNEAFKKKVVLTRRPRWIEGSTGSPRHNFAWYIWDWNDCDGRAATVEYGQ